ncbi:MAG: dethiobiotin synthase [Verrucomicrobiaceae bacterium]|nr:MAG: dethiobiotin synthase [Verrucomicrobiaceae bacterium]
MRAFVTGTDTGVGKTFATSLLTRALRRAGLDTIALKPLCSGDRGDAEILRSAAGDELSIDEVNPLWFQSPVAPLAAARKEDRKVSVPALVDWFGKVSAGRKSVLVEGAGGWLVPVADGALIADLCAALSLPVILVAANRLGCVNHVLLTIESIRSRGLECRGIILNTIQETSDEATRTNRGLFEEFAGVPILLELAPGQDNLDLAIA